MRNFGREKRGALTVIGPPPNAETSVFARHRSRWRHRKCGKLRARALYLAVTLSLVAYEKVGKVLVPCLHAPE
jgi:hypothetical protein